MASTRLGNENTAMAGRPTGYENSEIPGRPTRYETVDRWISPYESVDARDLSNFQNLSLRGETFHGSGNRVDENSQVNRGQHAPVTETEAITLARDGSFRGQRCSAGIEISRRVVGYERSERYDTGNSNENAITNNGSDTPDSNSDAASTDSETDWQMQRFCENEAAGYMERGDWRELESAVRDLLERRRRRRGPERYRYRHNEISTDERIVCWELWLCIAQLARGDTDACFETLERINLPSSGQGHRPNFQHIKLRVYWISSAALVASRRLDEAELKCKRAIKALKKVSTPYQNVMQLRIIDRGLGVQEFSTAPNELMAMIMQKAGKEREARFYRSLVPNTYADSGRGLLAAGGPIDMGNLSQRLLQKRLQTLHERYKVFNPTDGLTLNGDRTKIWEAVWDAIKTEVENPIPSALIFGDPLFVFPDGTPLLLAQLPCGWDPLLNIAAFYGAAATTLRLLDLGADPTALDRNNFTALHLISMLQVPLSANYIATAEHLTQRLGGAGLNRMTVKAADGSIRPDSTPPILAIKNHHPDLLRMFIASGLDKDSPEGNIYGLSLLHHASLSGNIPCMQLLLEAGANPNALSSTGETVLHFVTTRVYNNTEVIRLLCNRGGNCNKCVVSVQPCHRFVDRYKAIVMGSPSLKELGMKY